MTRRRGVGKAGIDRDEENTTLRLSSVRCTTLAADNLGIVARLQHRTAIGVKPVQADNLGDRSACWLMR